MSTTLERRLDALESRQSVTDPVMIIRIITLPEDAGAEPARADVGGRSIPRADGETAEAFLARVEAEAKLAAKPGCAGMALVWPEMKSDERSSP